MAERIWPELVPQLIKTWDGWPDDVRDTLRQWNRRRHLRFGYAPGRNRINGIYYFTCQAECGRFIESLHYMDAVVMGRPVCEECLIAMARSGKLLP